MADLKVVQLAPIRNEDAVSMARDLLDRAERGEVNFFAVVALTPDGCVIDGWTKAKLMRPFTVLGGIDAMKHRFMTKEVEF